MARQRETQGKSIEAMESCKHFSQQLSYYLDNELHGDERDAFEAHIGQCSACRVALTRERDFLEGIREARPIYQPPANLKGRIEPIVTESSGPIPTNLII